MLVKVSKTFAKFMNQTANESNLKFSAEVVEFSPSVYAFYVGDPFGPSQDYNPKTGRVKVIKVLFPYEYFSHPVYITTRQLVGECNRRNIQDVSGLKALIQDLCEV